MIHLCTYFDANYLPRGLVLYDSLKRSVGEFTLWVLCLDEDVSRILGQLDYPEIRAIPLTDLEKADPDLLAAKADRSLVEYFFTLTPAWCGHLLSTHPEIDLLFYVDADVMFFSEPTAGIAELGEGSIGIMEHRFPPQLADKETYGKYNVGILLFRNDVNARECLAWWRERCLEWCYDRLEGDRYADQKYLDRWPELFAGVVVLRDAGLGLAPWNWMTYRVDAGCEPVTVDGTPLVAYHFHGLRLYGSVAYDLGTSRYVRMPRALIRRLYEPYIALLAERARSIERFGHHGSPGHSLRRRSSRSLASAVARRDLRLVPGVVRRRVDAPTAPSSARDGTPARRRKVAIVQRYVPEYRVAFYEGLKEALDARNVELVMVHGQPAADEAARGGAARLPWAHHIRNLEIPIGSRSLVVQPCLGSLRDVDLVIVEQASKLLLNYELLGWRLAGGPRWAYWGHGVNFKRHAASQVGEGMKSFTSRRVDWWFAYTELTARLIRGLGYPSDRITIVNNSLEMSELLAVRDAIDQQAKDDLRAELGIAGEHVAIYCGAMYPEKRLDLLVAACDVIRELVPDFEIVILGGGTTQAIVERFARGRAWAHYVGKRHGPDRARLLLACVAPPHAGRRRPVDRRLVRARRADHHRRRVVARARDRVPGRRRQRAAAPPGHRLPRVRRGGGAGAPRRAAAGAAARRLHPRRRHLHP